MGWVSSDRAPAEQGSLASHSPSGFDYITLHRRELGQPYKIQRYVHSRIMHHGNFSMDLGLLALKTKTRNCQPKEGKQACNLSRENDEGLLKFLLRKVWNATNHRWL